MYKILVADDEKDIIKLLRLYLEKDDIKIYEAYDGEAAMQLLNEEEIDLAIVDIMMPKMNGFELIKKIRETNNIPIMIMSAKVETADKIFGLELGADDYITKPFDPMEVTARVNANLRRFYNLNQINNQHTSEIKVRDLILDIANKNSQTRLILFLLLSLGVFNSQVMISKSPNSLSPFIQVIASAL